MNSSVYVASQVKHKNDQEAITFFVPTQAGSQQAIHGLFDLMGDMELFNSYDQLILALQGLGYSSKQNDTKSFCLNPSLMRNDPSNAKLFAPFDKLKGAGVKKITLNCKGDRTGKHTDDIASHKEGERPSSGPTKATGSACISISFADTLALTSFAGTVRFILQYSKGSTGLSFDGFNNKALKQSGLTLFHIGTLQLHYDHWRDCVDENTVVFILNVDVNQSDAFPGELFKALQDIGKGKEIKTVRCQEAQG